mmetsp:Transcript_15947/g.43750  ORF Transcript_15947/g.43750 Transcript_15947/m.43750 type:complete len:244 (-) Transcript_15947:384-1115(-)
MFADVAAICCRCSSCWAPKRSCDCRTCCKHAEFCSTVSARVANGTLPIPSFDMTSGGHLHCAPISSTHVLNLCSMASIASSWKEREETSAAMDASPSSKPCCAVVTARAKRSRSRRSAGKEFMIPSIWCCNLLATTCIRSVACCDTASSPTSGVACSTSSVVGVDIGGEVQLELPLGAKGVLATRVELSDMGASTSFVGTAKLLAAIPVVVTASARFFGGRELEQPATTGDVGTVGWQPCIRK